MIHRLRYGLPASGDRILNHFIAWTAILLVVSILGFGGYYYWDRYTGTTGQTPEERALTEAQKAVVDDPSSLSARLTLASFYYNANRYKDSAEQYQAALSLDDKNLTATWGLGRSLLATGDGDGAQANFQKVLDATKDSDVRGDLIGGAYYYLGKIALSRNDPDTAISNLQQAVATDHGDADAMELLGAAYVAKGSYDSAIEQLTKAVHFVPDFTEAYTQLALAYDGKGMGNEARYARSMVLYAQGQLSKAAKELEAVTGVLPSFADAFTGLGLTRERLGQHGPAVEAYQRALSIDDKNYNARSGLVRLGAIKPDANDAHTSSQGGSQ